jgi:ankyrin repeat protein
MVSIMFISIMEKSSHPQAKLIPTGVWDSYFLSFGADGSHSGGDLPDTCIALMGLDRAGALQAIESLKGGKPIEKIRYIYCIAVTHPEIDLIKLCADFGLSDEAFAVAAALGRLSTLNALVESSSSEKLAALIKVNNYAPFRMAAMHGKLEVMNRLLELVPKDEQLAMIASRSYSGFWSACGEGHMEILNRLAAVAPGQLLTMIKSMRHQSFKKVACSGHLDIFDWLVERVKAEEGSASVIDIIKADAFEVFRTAVLLGHQGIVDRIVSLLEEYSPSDAPSLIGAGAGIDEAIVKRKLAILACNSYEPLHAALMNRHISIFQGLFNRLTPGHKIKMLRSNYYTILSLAVCAGNHGIVEQLLGLLSLEEKSNLITGFAGFALLMNSATSRNVATCQMLFTKINDFHPATVIGFRQIMLWQAIIEISKLGDSAMLAHLLGLAQDPAFSLPPADQEKKLIQILLAALRAGHLEIVESLRPRIPVEPLAAALALDHYQILVDVIKDGCVKGMNWLLTEYPAAKASVIASHGDRLWSAILSDHGKQYGILKRFILESPAIFSRAVDYCEKTPIAAVQPIVHLVLTELIREEFLKLKKEQLGARKGDVVFDITDPARIEKCRYMLKYYVITNKLEEMGFLLSIPSIRADLSQRMERGESALFDVASTKNPAAAELLLTIPVVSRVAAAKGYSSSAPVSARLKSSLTAGEQCRWLPAIAVYGAQLDGGGDPFAAMIGKLHQRYNDKPAVIFKDNGELLQLPLAWDAFSALVLTEAERARALQAYYQHPMHSAIRYLSAPNPWVDSAQPRPTFEEHKPLITLLWLAATDPTLPSPTDKGYTVEQRTEYFIQELALIARADNWKNLRDKRDEAGNVIMSEEGETVKERYDDREGDKPGCFSEVKERLLQSLVGHPLLPAMTEKHVVDELKGFLTKVFKSHITCENRDLLGKVWDGLVAMDDVDQEPLRALNVTEEEKIEFLSYMADKYGRQFTGEPRFADLIEARLPIDAEAIHVCTCDSYINLAELVRSPTTDTSAGSAAGANPHAMFSSAPAPAAAGAGAGAGAATSGASRRDGSGFRRGFLL